MVERGWSLVITHGNGPQVGFILRRNELAAYEMHTTPLDLIVADTQGSIGYMIAECLGNELKRRRISRPIASVVTRVLVDREDPAFDEPTKGIGGFMTEDSARVFEASGWRVVEDAGRGWRRVIASPAPLKIIEMDAIRALARDGFIVVAAGGGGIPVIETENGDLVGAQAVVDKDRASSMLARELGVDLLLISTSVPKVALHYREPEQQWLDKMTAAQAQAYHAAGHFKPGSMGPKIEAVLAFLEAHPAGRAIVTDPPSIVRALNGEGGTWIEA
jgi:carbamate kinase